MLIGLKLWSTDTGLIERSSELARKRLFDYLELYVVPNSGDTLERWTEWAIPKVLHAPHSLGGLNMAESGVVASKRHIFEEVERFREALQPKHMIFHPGIEGKLTDAKSNFAELAERYPAIAEIALIENKPLKGLNDEICLGATRKEISELMEAGGMGFCLDFGHAIAAANSLGKPWKEHVEDFLELTPSVFHLSDGDINAEIDAHWNLGKGSYPIAELAELLPNNAWVTLETEKAPAESLWDFAGDACHVLGAKFGLRNGFHLRHAPPADSRQVWEMANAPDIREASFNSDPIPWETHETWYQDKLQSSDSLFFLLIESATEKIAGQARFERKNGEWTISVSVTRDFRGKGLGTELIKVASEVFFDRHKNATAVNAYIKPENTASINSFARAGYANSAPAALPFPGATLMRLPNNSRTDS